MRCIRYSRFGDPDVLALCEAPLPEPGPGQVQASERVLVLAGAGGVGHLATLVDAGQLRLQVSATLPLRDAARTHALIIGWAWGEPLQYHSHPK